MFKATVVGAAALMQFMPLSRAHAQTADSVISARAEDVLVRVRRYTSSDVPAARVLADSLVNALPSTASAMPAALFAKASIAPSAAEAERGYERIVNDYRFASQVPDALMRLALLENARNNRTGALRHLDRLLRDHSDAPVRSRASLMAGRMRMDANDPARACELLAAAYASAGPKEHDVRDQATTVGAKCPTPVAIMAERDPPPMGVVRAAREVAVPSVVAPVPVPASRRARRGDTAVMPTPVATTPAVRRDTTLKPVVVAPIRRDTTPKPVVVAPIRRDTTPKPVAPAPAPKPVAPTVHADTAAARPATAGHFGVQFAAYNDRPSAEQYASILRSRGITARVEGVVAPFRVRAGRFTTRAEAEASSALWRRPGTAAIVVVLGPVP